MTTYIEQNRKLQIFKQGIVSRLFDFNLAASTFYQVGSDISLEGLDIREAQIYILGRYVFPSGLATDVTVTPERDAYITVTTTVGDINLGGHWEVAGGILKIGISHGQPIAYTVIAPYRTAKIYYYIFTY